LDDAISPAVLGQAISTRLFSLFSTADESIWLIRRLDLRVDVNAAWEPEQLTRTVVMQLARVVDKSLQDESDSANVLWFPNRTAYLSAFLSDVAAGSAWSKWCYESFAGLRLLSTSAALRSAICEQPDTGLEALLGLQERELKRVLNALTNQDVRRVLDQLAVAESAVSEAECCELAWSAWQDVPHFAKADEWRLALLLFLNASCKRREATGRTLRTATLALVSLERLLAELTIERREQLISALTSGDLASLHVVARASAEKLAPLLNCPAAWLREVVSTLTAPTGPATETANEPTRRDTHFGGIFLLLPLLDELPLTKATSGWHELDEAPAVTLVRFLLIVKCCGREHAARAFYDSLLRDLLLVPPAVVPATIEEWAQTITAAQSQGFIETLLAWQRSRVEDDQTDRILERVDKLADDLSFLTLPDSIKLSTIVDRVLTIAAQHLLRAFAWRLPGFAASSLPYLSANFLNFSAGFEEEATRRVVYVGRPPLHLVSGLTGMSRQMYRLSWLDERPLCLFPED
jgi:hypothetical protein